MTVETARKLGFWLFGWSTMEYWEYRRQEREYHRQRREADKEENGSARWIAAEHEWPGRHAEDVDDYDAATLIWQRAFTCAARDVTKNLLAQPLNSAERKSSRLRSWAASSASRDRTRWSPNCWRRRSR